MSTGSWSTRFGGVESLLKVKARRPSQNLLEMVDDDLKTVLAGALHRVRRDADSVRYPGTCRWPAGTSRWWPSRCATAAAR